VYAPRVASRTRQQRPIGALRLEGVWRTPALGVSVYQGAQGTAQPTAGCTSLPGKGCPPTCTACCTWRGGVRTPKEPGEAYTGNSIGRKSDCTGGSLVQPRKGAKADDDGLNAPEANPKAAVG
jgi:hypothetical protein